MKRYFFTGMLIILNFVSFGQMNTFPADGNVGIGTTSPLSKLHIFQNMADQAGLIVQGNTINTDYYQHYVAISSHPFRKQKNILEYTGTPLSILIKITCQINQITI